MEQVALSHYTTATAPCIVVDPCPQAAFPSFTQMSSAVPWTPRRLRRGAYLYRAGMPSTALYVVRFGTLKSSLRSDIGEDVVLAFLTRGDFLGADALADQPCATDVVALEDSEVLVLPISDFEAACDRMPALREDLYRNFAQAVRREREHLMRVGSMRAAQRLARFLLELSERLSSLGYSSRAFHLRMSRAEIGSYLGLTLESVSRLLSQLQARGVISVDLREIELLDVDALRALASAGDGRDMQA